MIYFLQEGAREPVKIGYVEGVVLTWRDDMYKRLTQLQVGNHRQLFVVAVKDGTWRDEQDLHRRFASLRIRGEWFRYDATLEAEMVAHRVKPWSLRKVVRKWSETGHKGLYAEVDMPQAVEEEPPKRRRRSTNSIIVSVDRKIDAIERLRLASEDAETHGKKATGR